MMRQDKRSSRQVHEPVTKASSSKRNDGLTSRFVSLSPLMRAFAGVCWLSLVMLSQGVAEPFGSAAKGPVYLHRRGIEGAAPRNLRQEHRAAPFLEKLREHQGVTAADKAPFIRPIAPMSALFSDDDLLRVPWSRFGLHRAPVHFHRSLSTITKRLPMKPWRDPFSPSVAMASADAMPTLTRFSQRAASMPWQGPEMRAPLASEAMPATGIGPARATQIQAALVHYGYLTGTPKGSWDASSVAAMRQLQSDHRWQTKFMPDARALIFLGLGPGSRAE